MTYIERLVACGVDRERAKMILDHYEKEGKTEELEWFVVTLEMHKKGED